MISFIAFATLQGSLTLPAFFSDHMVVQRGKPTTVWGIDKPGTKVTVQLNGKSAVVTADSNGKFSAAIPSQREGGPFELKISGTSEKVIKDVWVGEVWICSGQSNMEWVLANSFDREEGKRDADPHIRMFTVAKNYTTEPQSDVRGDWQLAQAETVDSFSAVGYAFARKLWRELKVPIGMIHTSWGGTPAEAWTSPSYMTSEMLKPIVDRFEAGRNIQPGAVEKFVKNISVWQQRALPNFFNETDLSWTSAGLDDSNWEKVSLPNMFPDQFDGTYFYRKSLTLTAGQAAQLSKLSLGPIDDLDIAYVNGVKVGSTDMTVNGYWGVPRSYKLPSGLLKAGVNIIAVKIHDHSGGGGFYGALGDFKLGDLDISKGWSRKQGEVHAFANAGPRPEPPFLGADQNSPGTLYNGMLLPLAPYSIRGAIWYQGESNAGRAVQYKPLMQSMIKNWRDVFNQPNFPFYIVQLANFGAVNPEQGDSAWAELRDVQDQLGLEKNCGTAATIDIGNPVDIHPRNKKDVGERLARLALANDYKKQVETQGPRIKSSTVVGSVAYLEYSHAKGLKTKDGEAPKGFMVAGADRKWHAPVAKLENGRVILSSPRGFIVGIRYAWQDSPSVNLVNSDELPAMPFRTDTWPLVTANNR